MVGIIAQTDKVIIVDAHVHDNGDLTIQADHTRKLQTGNRPQAYFALHRAISSYLNEHAVEKAIIKASATTGRAASMGVLHSAEVRGVVAAAAASAVSGSVEFVRKGDISKTFGDRKVNGYVKDEDFWGKRVDGESLRKGSREAAMLLMAHMGQ